jgi:hypothetical protein
MNNTVAMKLTNCEVGMFRLPGLIVGSDNDDPVPEELLSKMEEWCLSEQGTGKRMTDKMWSFRNEKQRSWFILRWSGESE